MDDQCDKIKVRNELLRKLEEEYENMIKDLKEEHKANLQAVDEELSSLKTKLVEKDTILLKMQEEMSVKEAEKITKLENCLRQ